MSNRFLRRLGLGAFALVLTAGIVVAANMSFSTGAHFLPGFHSVDGTDLNVIVDRVNTVSGGSITSNTLIGAGVNRVSLAGGATTVDPIITVGGTSSDTNIGLLIAGKGTGPVHLGGTDKTNGSVRIPTVTSAVNAIDLEGAATLGIPFITVGGLSSDTNDAIALYGKGTGSVLIGDVTTTLAPLQVAHVATEVNGVLVTGAATGSPASITPATAGADTNIGLLIATKGTGTIGVGGTTLASGSLQVETAASQVDFLAVAGGTTANPATVTAAAKGTDTNINMAVTPKGSGVVKVGGTIATCSGTTTSTCQGQRFVSSVTGLTTAASTLSAAMTVTDAAVVSSASIVVCQAQGYAGTGVPVVVNVTPGTGTVAFAIQNVSTAAALNATVAVGCFVFGT